MSERDDERIGEGPLLTDHDATALDGMRTRQCPRRWETGPCRFEQGAPDSPAWCYYCEREQTTREERALLHEAIDRSAALAAELAACRARRDEGDGEAFRILRDVEWGPEPALPDSTCPWCLRTKRDGHDRYCELGALLARRATAPPPAPPTATPDADHYCQTLFDVGEWLAVIASIITDGGATTTTLEMIGEQREALAREIDEWRRGAGAAAASEAK